VTKEGKAMLEKALDKIAEQIATLDEASLTQLRKKYLDRLFQFEPTKEWEKAVIIYFIINGVIAKNNLFNHHILEQQKEEIEKGPDDKGSRGGKSPAPSSRFGKRRDPAKRGKGKLKVVK
jgi:hypothetical protein